MQGSDRLAARDGGARGHSPGSGDGPCDRVVSATGCGRATRTGTGSRPTWFRSFRCFEEALAALGVVVWPMVEFEADDALASGARAAAEDERVEQVIVCTPDKDLAQCVVGSRIVQLDRRKRVTRDAAGVRGEIRGDAGVHTGLPCRGRATRRMGIRGLAGGGLNRRPPCLPGTTTLKACRRTGGRGM